MQRAKRVTVEDLFITCNSHQKSYNVCSCLHDRRHHIFSYFQLKIISISWHTFEIQTQACHICKIKAFSFCNFTSFSFWALFFNSLQQHLLINNRWFDCIVQPTHDRYETGTNNLTLPFRFRYLFRHKPMPFTVAMSNVVQPHLGIMHTR